MPTIRSISILVPSRAGGLTTGTALGNGQLTAGGAAATAGTISVTNNSANLVTINSAVVNNGAAIVALGTVGNVLLNAANTYTVFYPQSSIRAPRVRTACK